jgi:folate-binding Fe-S cluster repair protein YgfZ
MIAVVCIVLIGIMIKNYYRKRRNFFFDLCALCDHLKVNITYSQNKIDEIFCDFQKSCKNEFAEFLQSYQKFSKNEITKEQFLQSRILRILNEKEREDVTNFFFKLGNLGVDEEVEKIEIGKMVFQKIKEKCDEHERVLSPLYIKLFVVLALAVLIIFL